MKDQIIHMYKKVNKGKLEGRRNFIFIRENLAVKMKRVFNFAREFGKRYGYCCLSNGKILVREKETARLHFFNRKLDPLKPMK